MTTTEAPNYLRIAQAERLLHRKCWPLYMAVDSGELRASRPGGDGPWLIDPVDLRVYVEQHATRSAENAGDGMTAIVRIVREVLGLTIGELAELPGYTIDGSRACARATICARRMSRTPLT